MTLFVIDKLDGFLGFQSTSVRLGDKIDLDLDFLGASRVEDNTGVTTFSARRFGLNRVW